MHDDWPKYDALPDGRSWSVFESDDQFGTLNLLTKSEVLTGISCVRSGEVHSLNAPINWPDPPFFGRRTPRHEVFSLKSGNRDEYVDGFYPQSTSQWDGLGHVQEPGHGFYQGRPPESFSISAWAERGIAGRGVLLDVGRFYESIGNPLDWRERRVIPVADLQRCREMQGIEPRRGDILLVRTGWCAGYQSGSDEEREAVGGYAPSPGLDGSAEMAGFLWDWGVSAVAADNPGVEALPAESQSTRLHATALVRLGIPFGELWWMDGLAAACAVDRRYDFLLVAAPLKLPGGIGSTANALALR